MPGRWSSSSPEFHLDWSPGSGSGGLADALRTAIRAGRLAEGQAMPSTRALAQDLGLARGTVTRIYADLAAEGYLRNRQGAPTRVATNGIAPAAPPRDVLDEPGTRWSLRPGRPDLSAFPRAQWLSATRRALQEAPASAFGYPERRGTAALRTALARHLARSRGVVADPERIVVCGGISMAMSLLTRVLRERGITEIAFEDPSLPVFHEVVRAGGARVVGVGVDSRGIKVSEVDSPAVVVTPAHQSPLGVTLAPERRKALVEHGALVIEDDYDGEFRYDRRPVGAVQALAPERVVYAGTASKTLAPALRMAWLVLPRSLVDPVLAAMAATGWQPPVLEQLVLAELLVSGAYDRHVRRSRATYRARRDRLLAALPARLSPAGISAGLHLVLPLPDEGPTEREVQAAARRRSLTVETLGWQWLTPGEHPQGLVLGYGTPAQHAFGPTLAALLDSLADVGFPAAAG